MIDILEALKAERERLRQQTETVESAIAIYTGQATGKYKRKGKMTAAGRAKISKAQKARWALKRKADKSKGKAS